MCSLLMSMYLHLRHLMCISPSSFSHHLFHLHHLLHTTITTSITTVPAPCIGSRGLWRPRHNNQLCNGQVQAPRCVSLSLPPSARPAPSLPALHASPTQTPRLCSRNASSPPPRGETGAKQEEGRRQRSCHHGPLLCCMHGGLYLMAYTKLVSIWMNLIQILKWFN
jgi:hypothetical protein